MKVCLKILGCWLAMSGVLIGWTAPVIDPIPNATIPAGKSLILPITATVTNGRALTYTITSSTNDFAVITHAGDPFWQLTVAQAAPSNAPGAYLTPYRGGVASVTNVGNMMFMLFPDYAPHTVNVMQGLTYSGFYNSNTIFHRVISKFIIQGGDPKTNGFGGLTFQYNDEFNPQAIFSGNGQLALANSGKNTDGSQFFVTVGQQRFLDFGYTLYGQLVRGWQVLSNLNATMVDTNSRPLADEIIQTASFVTNTSDTVVTLTATNVPGVTGLITVIADDGNGGRATNKFTATTVTDTNSNNQPFFYPNDAVTNLVAPKNTTLTNFISAVELDGEPLYWYAEFGDTNSANSAPNSSINETNGLLTSLTYNVTNADGLLEVIVEPSNNYAGPINLNFFVSTSLQNYDALNLSFVFGDTPIVGATNPVTALAGVAFTNVLLATFTNGIPGSSATNFTANMNWGDNVITQATVTTNTGGVKMVLGSHTYPYPGSYPVYVAVQSTIGASETLLSYVLVTNVVPPTLAITAPASGQTITNWHATKASLTGTAADNVTVTQVWTQVNGGAWTPATGTTNWTAGFTPAYGATNTLLAYAVNNLGQASLTNSVAVKYLAGDYLTVRTNGLGTITPNLNQALLPLGSNYLLAAAPAAGFVFTNWTLATNGLLIGVTNNPALQFVMTSNLTLQATLVETSRPSLAITAPLGGLSPGNPTVTGTASDIWAVTNVYYQLNNGAWTTPSTANGWTNWSTTVALVAGNNTLNAYAVNQGGDLSLTNRVTIVSSNGFKLQLSLTTAKPWTTNGFNVSLQVSSNLIGHIQYSTNLSLWTVLTNFAGTNATLNFRDAAATNGSRRFYRAVIP